LAIFQRNELSNQTVVLAWQWVSRGPANSQCAADDRL
jgi:hypothetical protein